MKTSVAVLLCALALNASCAEKTSAEAEHDREKRWDLPDIDVSWPASILCVNYCKRSVFIHDLKTLFSVRPVKTRCLHFFRTQDRLQTTLHMINFVCPLCGTINA